MELQILQIHLKSLKLSVSQVDGGNGLYACNHVEYLVLSRSDRRILHSYVLEQAIPGCSIGQEDS